MAARYHCDECKAGGANWMCCLCECVVAREHLETASRCKADCTARVHAVCDSCAESGYSADNPPPPPGTRRPRGCRPTRYGGGRP